MRSHLRSPNACSTLNRATSSSLAGSFTQLPHTYTEPKIFPPMLGSLVCASVANEARHRILLRLNGAATGRVATLPSSFDELLDMAKRKLHQPVTRLFLSTGDELDSDAMEVVREGDVIYASGGEVFSPSDLGKKSNPDGPQRCIPQRCFECLQSGTCSTCASCEHNCSGECLVQADPVEWRRSTLGRAYSYKTLLSGNPGRPFAPQWVWELPAQPTPSLVIRGGRRPSDILVSELPVRDAVHFGYCALAVVDPSLNITCIDTSNNPPPKPGAQQKLQVAIFPLIASLGKLFAHRLLDEVANLGLSMLLVRAGYNVQWLSLGLFNSNIRLGQPPWLLQGSHAGLRVNVPIEILCCHWQCAHPQ